MYKINNVFYSLQGEGYYIGRPSIFIRFTGCNLACNMVAGPRSPGGFDCDTEFESGRKLSLEDLHEWVKLVNSECKWLVLTGGEPALQVDNNFCNYFQNYGYKLQIETNGSIEVNELIDWITLSPKVAEHAIAVNFANEIRYVRNYGQSIPKPKCNSSNKYISPAFDGDYLPKQNLDWCIKLCKENPEWRLSVQQHKFWGIE